MVVQATMSLCLVLFVMKVIECDLLYFSLHEEVLAQRALDRRLTEELMRFKSTIATLTE